MQESPELSTGATPHQSPSALRFFAQLVSVFFHPLFIPTWLTVFTVYREPYFFAGLNSRQLLFKLISVVFSTAFLPLFSVLLMKQLGFIKSIFLRDQKDRIIPYIVSMIFYFWAWYVSRNLHDHPAQTAMLLAVFLCSIAGMMANIYYKISMHGLAVGAMVCWFIWLAYYVSPLAALYLPLAILVTGLVCTARFVVSDHSPFEIYSGLIGGIICQLIAIAVTG